MSEHLSGNASPTERTMSWLRGLGYTVGKVEYRLTASITTVDLFGFIDIVAIKAGVPGVLGVQATTAAHVREREYKVREEPRAMIWLAAGNRIQVVGWALAGAAGTRKLWTPTVLDITEGL